MNKELTYKMRIVTTDKEYVIEDENEVRSIIEQTKAEESPWKIVFIHDNKSVLLNIEHIVRCETWQDYKKDDE